MFTGLVEAVGELVERKTTSGGFRLRIGSALAPELAPGDSLAVNGVCLTVILAEENEIHADVGPETIRVTTLGRLTRGCTVNLERPLRVDSRFGGHFVQGHVDTIGHVEEFRQDAEFHWLTVSFPSHLAPYIIHKGSIAVDGISLTVAGLGADRFDVQVVPYTMEHTNLRRAAIRDRVNIECDMIGKYVIRAAELAGLTLNRALPGETTH
jgi:riboflavin synthase